jgi:hypothetical protein
MQASASPDVDAAHEKADPPHGSHDQHAGHRPEMFRDRFWL